MQKKRRRTLIVLRLAVVSFLIDRCHFSMLMCVHLGGDGPEAVAPALHAAVHTLSWRKSAVKVALLIADAPPHGLETVGDGFPNGNDDAFLFFGIIFRMFLR